MQVLEWILILLGHLAVCCVLFNLVHAASTPRRGSLLTRKFTEKLILGFAVVPPAIAVAVLLFRGRLEIASVPLPLWFYFRVAEIVGIFFLLRWFYRLTTAKLPSGVVSLSSEIHDIQSSCDESLLNGTKAKMLGWLPFNQVTRLQIEHWEFQFTDLPDDLSGFRICQLSDLHFTGLLKPDYFRAVVTAACNAQPDLILITGDIIDDDRCLPWLEEVLGQLQAPYGVYYVLGNHDRLVHDQGGLRQRLNEAGLQKAANGKWHEIQVGEARLLLAGNELPWYREAENLPPGNAVQDGFRLLLAHSPDQIGWAVRRQFDLLFAGHLHGGQIRLPIVGPIIAPSRYGIKYASGTFRTRNTLLHVSRGISSDEPIRINCPPELGLFVLKKALDSE